MQDNIAEIVRAFDSRLVKLLDRMELVESDELVLRLDGSEVGTISNDRFVPTVFSFIFGYDIQTLFDLMDIFPYKEFDLVLSTKADISLLKDERMKRINIDISDIKELVKSGLLDRLGRLADQPRLSAYFCKCLSVFGYADFNLLKFIGMFNSKVVVISTDDQSAVDLALNCCIRLVLVNPSNMVISNSTITDDYSTILPRKLDCPLIIIPGEHAHRVYISGRMNYISLSGKAITLNEIINID